MQNIKHNLIQGNNRENKSDGFDFSGVSEINDLCFKNEFDRVNCFSYIIAVVYAISLVILRLSLIFIPTAISIYITLFVLVIVPIAIALYCKKKHKNIKSDGETKIFSDEAIKEIEKEFFDKPTSDILFNPNNDILLVSETDKNLSQKIEINIKPILKLDIYFFIFAFISVAVNLIFLQTIFIYIFLAVLAIIIFSVGYKIHKINSYLKDLNSVNDDDDIVDIEKLITEKNIESHNKSIAQENAEISEIENIDLFIY